MSRWLRHLPGLLLASVLPLLGLLLMGLVALLGTEGGNRWLVQQLQAHNLANPASPVEVHLGQLSGHLLRGLTLQELTLITPTARIAAERIHLHLTPLALLRGELRLAVLHLTDLHITTSPATTTTLETDPWLPFSLPTALPMPLDLTVERLRIDRLVWWQEGEAQAGLESLHLAASLTAERWAIDTLHLADPWWRGAPDLDATLTGTLHLAPQEDYVLALSLDADLAVPPALHEAWPHPRLQGGLSVQGALRQDLSLALALRSGTATWEGTATLQQPLVAPQLQTQWQWNPFAYRPETDQEWRVDAGQLHLQTDGRDWQVELSTALQPPAQPRAQLDLALRATHQPPAQFTVDLHHLTLTLPEESWSLQGGVELDLAQPQIQLRQWQLHPRSGGELTLDATGSYQEDDTWPFVLQITATDLDFTTLPFAIPLQVERLQAATHGTWQATHQVLELAVDLPWLAARWEEQSVTATTRLQWQANALVVDFLQVASPTLGSLQFRGRAAFPSLERRTPAAADTPSAPLPARTPLPTFLSTTALPDWLFEQWHIQFLEARRGSSRLTAQGTLDQHWDLALSLTVPQLAEVLPDGVGQLQLAATLAGPRTQPRLQAEGHAQDLRWLDHALDRLDLRVEAGLEDTVPLDVRMDLTGLQTADVTVADTVRLEVRGTVQEHQAELQVIAPDRALVQLRLQGSYAVDPVDWQGELRSFSLRHPVAGAWQLVKPVALQLSPQQLQAKDFCLAQDGSTLCLTSTWDHTHGASLQGAVRDLQWSTLDPWLPDGLSIAGPLDIDFSGRYLAPAGDLQAELTIPPAQGLARFDLEDGREQLLPFRDLRAEARFAAQRLDLRFGLSFLEEGNVSGSIALIPAEQGYRWDGQVDARLENLQWLALLTPELQQTQGRLGGRLLLSGPLQTPVVQGELWLLDASALVPEAGLVFAVPELRAQILSVEQILLSGRIRSENHEIFLNGEGGLRSGRPQASVRLHGERFLVVNRPELRAEIRPDLQVQWHPERLRVRGQVDILSALAQPPDLPPGSIRVSRDEVIVGETAPPAPHLQPDIRIRIRLGDQVRFSGYGLEARFTGQIELVDQAGRPLQAFGEIQIPEGTYQSYGQDLRIGRGLIIFQGPIEAPSLNLRAVRYIREYDVTAGIEIGGIPGALHSRVFSEPPMDAAEAMSYLIAGRPLSGATRTEGNLIANAATNWGLDQAAQITQRIGGEIGLDEFELAVDAGLAGTALTMGKYLSPRLLLRYSVGLFDESYQVLLRYELTRSLSIETTSSRAQRGVDLIYQIER